MIVHAWRIFKPKHAATALTGEGARLYGGRWSKKGISVIYAAGSKALAALEMLVHLSSAELIEQYHIRPLSFEQTQVENLNAANLPADWQSDPAPIALKEIGDAWIQQARSAVLRVPSAVVTEESNYLLNPAHRDFAKLVAGPVQSFRFDPRLKK